jgi:tRNA(Ile)-lysidine synthase
MVMNAAANPVIEAVRRALARLEGRSSAGSASILVALSGGADSVALLHAMRELAPRFGYRVAAAHLNHCLRGAESDRDESFVRELCGGLGVELIIQRACGLDMESANLEERCRDLRWTFLAAAAARLAAPYVATAHHADDQAETVMLRLLRGAGIAGMGAMGEVGSFAHGLMILRPMLAVGRAEIEAYLDSIDARFVNDSTNLNRGFLRNRVRLELIPFLERSYAPGLRGRLAGLATEMREADDFIAQAAQAELAGRLDTSTPAVAMNLDHFAGLNPALMAAVLRAYLEFRIGGLRHITRSHIGALKRLCMSDSPSCELDLPNGWRARRQYARLLLCPVSKVSGRLDTNVIDRYSVPLAREGSTIVSQAGFVFDSKLVSADAVSFPETLFEACFDLECIPSGLCVRNFEPGDRVNPIGMDGTRKLQDIFVDRKLERAHRRSYPVVTLKEHVAWVPGMVRGNVALVRPDSSKVLRLNALETSQIS